MAPSSPSSSSSVAAQRSYISELSNNSQYNIRPLFIIPRLQWVTDVHAHCGESNRYPSMPDVSTSVIMFNDAYVTYSYRSDTTQIMLLQCS